MLGGPLHGSGGGIMPTDAYRPFSLDRLLYDGVGEVELPNLDSVRFDLLMVPKPNAFDKDPCNFCTLFPQPHGK